MFEAGIFLCEFNLILRFSICVCLCVYSDSFNFQLLKHFLYILVFGYLKLWAKA